MCMIRSDIADRQSRADNVTLQIGDIGKMTV